MLLPSTLSRLGYLLETPFQVSNIKTFSNKWIPWHLESQVQFYFWAYKAETERERNRSECIDVRWRRVAESRVKACGGARAVLVPLNTQGTSQPCWIQPCILGQCRLTAACRQWLKRAIVKLFERRLQPKGDLRLNQRTSHLVFRTLRLNSYCLGYKWNLTVGWNVKVGSFLSDSDAPDWRAMENIK